MTDHVFIDAVSFRKKTRVTRIKGRQHQDNVVDGFAKTLATYFIKAFPWKQGLAGLRYLFTSRSSIRNDGVPGLGSLIDAGWESEQALVDAVFRALEVEAVVGTVIAGEAKAAERYRYRMELAIQRANYAGQYYDLAILEIIRGFEERVSHRAQEFLYSPETLAQTRRKLRSNLPFMVIPRRSFFARLLLRLVFLVPLALFTYITYQTRELADRAFRVALWIWGVLAAIAVLRILRSLYYFVSTPARYRKDPYHHPTAT
jgi:hypothetical protein